MKEKRVDTNIGLLAFKDQNREEEFTGKEQSKREGKHTVKKLREKRVSKIGSLVQGRKWRICISYTLHFQNSTSFPELNSTAAIEMRRKLIDFRNLHSDYENSLANRADIAAICCHIPFAYF